MTQATHQKFQTLLQVAADQALRPEEQSMLDRHLATCDECRKYAQNLSLLQDGLRRVMQQQWNVRAKPMSAQQIKARSARNVAQHHTVTAFGKFAFIPILALTIFMVLSVRTTNPQKASPGYSMASGTPSMALIVPKPPASITAAQMRTQTCKPTTYVAQEHETLGSIAIKFGVSKEAIASYNGISGDKLNTPLTLLIPICENTPLETTTTPTIPNTMTIPADNPSPIG